MKSTDKITIPKTIRSVRSKLGFSQAAFAEKMGVSNQYISAIETRTLPSLDFLRRVHEEFNVSWDTLLDGCEYNTGEARPVDRDILSVPFITVRAQAGFAEVFGDLSRCVEIEQIPVKRNGKNPTIAFEAEGVSMQPVIMSGATICCVEVLKGDWDYIGLNRKDVYVLLYGNQFLVKYIYNKARVSGVFELHSENTAQYPEPQLIDPNNVVKIWRVIKVIYDFEK